MIINILHLSDLHFGTIDDAELWYGQLYDDLKNNLKCDGLDALIISGDIANFSEPSEYKAAHHFLKLLGIQFGLNADNTMIVPGNHDLNWKIARKEGYRKPQPDDFGKKLEPGAFIQNDNGDILIWNAGGYQERFRHFSAFYEKLKEKQYPKAYADQGTLLFLESHQILVLGLNSAWELDHHHTSRVSIHNLALERALERIRGNPFDDWLKIAVWHHPLNSSHEDRIKEQGFMARLAQNGFSVALHGHLHKDTPPLFMHEKIQVVGVGAFGAPIKEWTPGYPLQYNLLRIRDNRMAVITRKRPEVNGAWDAGSQRDIQLPRIASQASSKTSGQSEPKERSTTAADAISLEALANYAQKAWALHEKIPMTGFKTNLRASIRVADIYVPLGAMIDKRVVGKACFGDAAEAGRYLDECGGGQEISIPDAFVEAAKINRRGIVILGDPGSGKTTHLKRVLLWCLGGGLETLGLPQGMIPVFLPLRELQNLDQNLEAFIRQQLADPFLETPDGFGRALLDRGNLLFLLDGLDEVAEAYQRAEVSRWIEKAHAVYPTSLFVVTSRFAGYTEKARLNPDFLEIHIRPMTTEQAEAFIRNWYGIIETQTRSDQKQARLIADEKTADLIDRLRQPEFRARRVFEMTRNPLLLTNLCLVHLDRGNLPHTRAALYEECTEVLLERWRAANKVATRIQAKSGMRMLQPAALWLHQKENRTRARADELEQVIDPAIKAVGWQGSTTQLLKAIQEESGILTGWGDGSYGFMHLGFQEYLAAREIRRLAFKQPAILKELAGHFGESWWQEVILLLLALEDPSLFEPFMRQVVKHRAFAEQTELIEMCLDDAAETYVAPFTALLNRTAGKNKELWRRQLAALRIVDRLDADAFEVLASDLREHPYDQIRELLQTRFKEEHQGVIVSEPSGYELVYIPGGVFMMGSPESEKGRGEREGPQHEVNVPAFYMGRYPVTNAEYGKFLSQSKDAREPKYWGDRKYNQPRQPVVGVSWHDAKAYADWAGLQLPSEAQWEYACRAGTTTRYYTGDSEADLDRAGWYDENSGRKLHAVGEKEPNAFGLYDMHGNVYEWVEDDWHDNYEDAPADGRAWIDDGRGARRVVRGGGWYLIARVCRSADRGRGEPDYRFFNLGFRLVLRPVQ